jgi:hypothetical protein
MEILGCGLPAAGRIEESREQSSDGTHSKDFLSEFLGLLFEESSSPTEPGEDAEALQENNHLLNNQAGPSPTGNEPTPRTYLPTPREETCVFEEEAEIETPNASTRKRGIPEWEQPPANSKAGSRQFTVPKSAMDGAATQNSSVPHFGGSASASLSTNREALLEGGDLRPVDHKEKATVTLPTGLKQTSGKLPSIGALIEETVDTGFPQDLNGRSGTSGQGAVEPEPPTKVAQAEGEVELPRGSRTLTDHSRGIPLPEEPGVVNKFVKSKPGQNRADRAPSESPSKGIRFVLPDQPLQGPKQKPEDSQVPVSADRQPNPRMASPQPGVVLSGGQNEPATQWAHTRVEQIDDSSDGPKPEPALESHRVESHSKRNVTVSEPATPRNSVQQDAMTTSLRNEVSQTVSTARTTGASNPFGQNPHSASVTGQALDDGVEELFSRMVERSHLARSGREFEFVVRLKPEFLGNLKIRATLDANQKIHAVISAEDAGVRMGLEERISGVLDRLQAQGLDVETMDIEEFSQERDMAGDERNAASRGEASRDGKRADSGPSSSGSEEEDKGPPYEDGHIHFYA